MHRLKNHLVTYDSNILVYYSFLTKEYEIQELTSKTHDLTEYLINNNSKILIPQFIIDEINRVTFSKIVSDYLSNGVKANNLPKHPTFLFKIELEGKIRKKFNNFLDKDWVIIIDFNPSVNLVDSMVMSSNKFIIFCNTFCGHHPEKNCECNQ